MKINERFEFTTEMKSMCDFCFLINKHGFDDKNNLKNIKKTFDMLEISNDFFEKSKVSFEFKDKNSNIENNFLGFKQLKDLEKNKIITFYGFYLETEYESHYFCIYLDDDDLSLIYDECNIKNVKNINYDEKLFECLFEEKNININEPENIVDAFVEILTYINCYTNDKEIKKVINCFEKKHNLNLE